MPKRNLTDRVADMDYPGDVREYVLNEIAKNGNEGRILAGELVLPSRQDAIHAHDRLHGRFGLNEDQKILEKRIQELEGKLQAKREDDSSWASLHSSTPPAPPPPEQPTPTLPLPTTRISP